MGDDLDEVSDAQGVEKHMDFRADRPGNNAIDTINH